MTPEADRARPSGAVWAALAVGLLAGLAVRAILLPRPGLAGDLDEFASWVHALAVRPIGTAYDIDLTFPPVMVYVWAALGAVEPAFRTVTDASDPWIRVLMRIPPTLADLGLMAGVAFALRSRPGWAIAGALAIWLHPAIVDLSALFGQYEAIYTLFGLVAFLLAVSGRPTLAAIALGLALMTKPQALPFLVPFGAWFLAVHGWRTSLWLAGVGGLTILVLWLPFLAEGGPAGYLRSVEVHQDELFGVLSLRAWNPWWIVQQVGANGSFVSDQAAFLGPITFRHIGYAVAGLLELGVFVAVWRRPTPRTLAIGLAASVLVAFTFLTTMHERYAFAALVFLTLLIPDRRFLGIWLVFGAVWTLNLLSAIPPSAEIEALLPVNGPLGIAGSVVLYGVTLAVLWALLRAARSRPAPGEPSQPPHERDPVPVEVVG
jgi:dolichyl-phosphate-mannose-protein mannosyltransferase